MQPDKQFLGNNVKKPRRRSAAGPRLPPDSVLLPLSSGALLVSRNHAVFCRIPVRDVGAVRRVLTDGRRAAHLRPALRQDLVRHGVFGPPRRAKPDVPTVQLQVANACNLDCSYCCTNSGPRRAREVTLAALRNVIRQIPAALGPATEVALLGGEPLLVPWVPELASEILDLGLGLTLFSNGLPLVDEDLARRIAALMQRGAKVRSSLAGPSAAACDRVSGQPRFEPALQAVRQLARFGQLPSLDLMLIPQHVDDIVRELPGLRQRLPAGTPLSLGVLYRGGRESGAHLFRSRVELEAALDRVAFETGELIPAARPSPVMDRREACSCALGRHVHVRSDGALFHCFRMEEQIGDLSAGGFLAAVKAGLAHPGRAVTLPTCRRCPLATLCGAGCRSENLLYTGDADQPPCGPWRIRVVSELLAEDRVAAVEWPVTYLLEEARARGLEPPDLTPQRMSRHLSDT